MILSKRTRTTSYQFSRFIFSMSDLFNNSLYNRKQPNTSFFTHEMSETEFQQNKSICELYINPIYFLGYIALI